MPSIQLPYNKVTTVKFGVLKPGEDFRINDPGNSYSGLLGTKVTEHSAVVYTECGIGLKQLSTDLKVTPLALKLVITEG